MTTRNNYWSGLPTRVKVALVIGMMGTGIAAAAMSQPFVPAGWDGFAIGAVIVTAVAFISAAPLPLTVTTAALTLLVSIAMWRVRDAATTGNVAVFAVLALATGVWVLYQRRRSFQ